MAGGLAGCPADTQETVNPELTGQVCRLPPTPHYVQYRAFIPLDNLLTIVPCYAGQPKANPLPPIPGEAPLGLIKIMGDASNFSTHYRIKEYADLSISTTGPGLQVPVVPVPSRSYNFEWPSVYGNIKATDLNPPRLLICVLEQNTGIPSLANEAGTTSSTAANQASVTFCCSASDPLFSLDPLGVTPVQPIRYNLTVSVNAATNTATITGSHTCFPSHEIVIGTQVVYQKTPAILSFAYLSYCLVTSPLPDIHVNCTVKLDGVEMSIAKREMFPQVDTIEGNYRGDDEANCS